MPHSPHPCPRRALSSPKTLDLLGIEDVVTGAGFVVVLCGDMQRVPGLGRTPAYMKVDIDEHGRTIGLF